MLKIQLQVQEHTEFTSKFHFIIACFPDTSESFINKSLGETLPKVSGRRDELIDCTEQRSPREGPLITSRVRQLPALLRKGYVIMLTCLARKENANT